MLTACSSLNFAFRDTTFLQTINSKYLPTTDTTEIIQVEEKGSNIEFENYVDFNFAYDFNNPINQTRLYGSNPTNVNQFNLSYAYSQLKFENERIKVVTAFATGSIVKLMYLGESSELKWVREISLFYKFKKEGWGIEAGIMPSIYGVETFINRDNQHATRAVMTDFAPDFEQGVRFHYKFGDNWRGKFQVTNGWQVIKDNNNCPGFGWVNIIGNPDKSFVNLGLYAGNEPYQGLPRQTKLYSNLFAKINIGNLSIWPMFDIGFQKDTLRALQPFYCYGASVKYQFSNAFSMAARYEHVQDEHAIITELLNPTNQWVHDGFTATIQYVPFPNFIVRLETVLSKATTTVYTISDGSYVNYDNIILMAVHYTLPVLKYAVPEKGLLH